MTKKIRPFIKGFTLVELIIVIAIVAILSVVAFMVVTKWIGKSKDTRRLADLGTMKRSLEVGLSENNYVPMPDVSSGGVLMTGVIGTKEAVYAGVYGDTVVKTLKNMKSAPIDPVSQVNYGYGIDSTRKKYEVAVTLEDGSIVTDLTNSVYAGTPQARVEGNYGLNDMYVYDENNDNIIVIPSLIITGINGGIIDLTDKTKVRYIVNQGNNIPYKTPGIINTITEDPVESLKRVINRNEVSEISVNLSSVVTSLNKANEVVKIVPDRAVLLNVINMINAKEGITMIQIADAEGVPIVATSYIKPVSGGSSTSSTGGPSPLGCIGTNITYSGHSYSLGSLNHGSQGTYVSSNVNENNGVFNYSLTVTCNNGSYSNYVESLPNNISCNSNFYLNGGACTSWICGNKLKYDGYDYSTLKVGNICWINENMRNSVDSLGNSLSSIRSCPGNYCTTGTGGALYAYPGSITSPTGKPANQGICPDGWRIPTWNEASTMGSTPGANLEITGYCDGNGSTCYTTNRNDLYITVTGSPNLWVCFWSSGVRGCDEVRNYAATYREQVRCVKDL